MVKSKVMICTRYGNEGRMHVRSNGPPIVVVDCRKQLGLQVAADACCERDVVQRMNELYIEHGLC